MIGKILNAGLLIAALFLPQAALAFCGGWDTPVAMGFDHGSWAEKWPVLAGILGFVTLFSTLVIRQMRAMRSFPEEV